MNLTKLLAPALALLLPATTHADFYDGARGPSKAQIHYTANFGETTSNSLAGKYFGKNYFAVGALSAEGKNFSGGFGGLGFILEHFGVVNAIPILGYAVFGDGKQGAFQGIAQTTLSLDHTGGYLLDARYTLAVPAHGQEHHLPQHSFGLTPSIGADEFRIGPDLSYKLGDPHLSAAGLVRYDLDAKKHSSWVEFGLGNTGAQIQFRGNF